MTPFIFDPDDGGSGEIPAGHHDVKITGAVAGENRKGNPNIRVELEDSQGRELADWVVVIPSTMWKVEELWRAAGVEWPEQGGEIDERHLIGRTVHIEVFEDEYQGKTRMKVREWTSMFGPEIPADMEGLPTGPADEGGGFATAAGLDDSDELGF